MANLGWRSHAPWGHRHRLSLPPCLPWARPPAPVIRPRVERSQLAGAVGMAPPSVPRCATGISPGCQRWLLGQGGPRPGAGRATGRQTLALSPGPNPSLPQRSSRKRLPCSKPLGGLLCWMASVAFGIEPAGSTAPAGAVVTRFGTTPRQHDQWKPMGGAAHIPPISCPCSQSPCRMGPSRTEAGAGARAGPVGLWIYNDAPLREAGHAAGRALTAGAAARRHCHAACTALFQPRHCCAGLVGPIFTVSAARWGGAFHQEPCMTSPTTAATALLPVLQAQPWARCGPRWTPSFLRPPRRRLPRRRWRLCARRAAGRPPDRQRLQPQKTAGACTTARPCPAFPRPPAPGL